MAQMKLFPAGAPVLVRCNQKDRFYTDHITTLLSETSRQFLPLHLWLKWQRELQLVAELSYFAITTVLGNQTLGEEYCNVIQVGPQAADGRYVVAGLLRRSFPIILQTVGVYALEKTLEVIYKKIRDRNLGSLQLTEREYDLLEKIVGGLEDTVSGIARLHLALFYIHGLFYHLGKRLVGIRYLMIRYSTSQSQNLSPLNTYSVLGWLIVTQLVVQVLKLCYKMVKLRGEKPAEDIGSTTTREGGMKLTVESSLADVPSQFKCPLCLELCCKVTATVCGHLFCWSCICEWTSEKTECPVCRTTVHPQQLTCLQHFSV